MLVEAGAAAVGADVAVLRVVEPDGRGAIVRGLAGSSPALVAELEGSRVPLGDLPTAERDERTGLTDALRAVAG